MRFLNIDTDERMKSVIQYGTSDFPLLVFYDDFDYYRNHCINWHWHAQLEFAVVLSGKIEYHVANLQIVLEEGEGVFINANNLHMGKPFREKGSTDTPRMFSLAFSTDLLATANHGNIYNKYILPIISNPSLQMVMLSQEIPWQKQVLSYLVEVYSLDQIRSFGYEMKTHSALFSAWQEMVLNLDDSNFNQDEMEVLSQERLRTMLAYIHREYASPIGVEDIAKSANVSKSTCYRCFRSCLRKAPLEYLKEYRLDKAMSMLVNEPEASVSEISTNCGFDSTSYFIHNFKNETGKTPLAYRKSPTINCVKIETEDMTDNEKVEKPSGSPQTEQ